MKLHEITCRYEQILDELDYLDITDDAARIIELKNELNELDLNAEDKAIYYANNIKNLESEIASIEDALNKMKKRKLSLESKVKAKVESLKYLMEKTQLETIRKSPHFVIRLKESREIIDIIDEKVVPKDYLRSKVVTEVDKIKSLHELKCGVVIPGLTIKKELRVEIK